MSDEFDDFDDFRDEREARPKGNPRVKQLLVVGGVVGVLGFLIFGGNGDPPEKEGPDCKFTVAAFSPFKDGMASHGVLTGPPQNEENLRPQVRWLREWMYPSLMQYCHDELKGVNPEEKEYKHFRSELLGLNCNAASARGVDVAKKKNSGDPAKVTLRFSLPEDGTNLCVDGNAVTQVGDLEHAIATLEQDLTDRGLVGRNDKIRLQRSKEELTAHIPGTRGEEAFSNLVLAQLQLYRGMRQACGPFDALTDTAKQDFERNRIRLRRNPHYTRGIDSALWPVDGCDNAGGASLQAASKTNHMTYCWMTLKNKTEFCTEADYGVAFADHDVCRGSLRKGYVAKRLPVGRQVWAAINGKKFKPKGQRRAIYSEILAAAVKDQLEAKQIDQLFKDTPPATWFPAQGRWAAGNQTLQNIKDIQLVSEDGGEPTDVLVSSFTFDKTKGSCKSLPKRGYTFHVGKNGKSPDFDKFPLLRAIQKRLITCVGEEAKLTETKDQNTADFAIFVTQFDSIYEDPTELILAHNTLLTSYKPTVKANYRTKLEALRRNVLIDGPTASHVSREKITIQSDLFRAAWLYPLFDEPYYVYYDPARLQGVPQMNGRAGLIGLDSWGPKPGSLCGGGPTAMREMPTKNSVPGTPPVLLGLGVLGLLLVGGIGLRRKQK